MDLNSKVYSLSIWVSDDGHTTSSGDWIPSYRAHVDDSGTIRKFQGIGKTWTASVKDLMNQIEKAQRSSMPESKTKPV